MVYGPSTIYHGLLTNTMNQKYKPGIIFGVIMMPVYFFNSMFIFHSPDHSKHILSLSILALVGGAISGFLYGWFTIWYDARKVKGV